MTNPVLRHRSARPIRYRWASFRTAPDGSPDAGHRAPRLAAASRVAIGAGAAVATVGLAANGAPTFVAPALVASIGLSCAGIAQLAADHLRRRAPTATPLQLGFDGSTGDLEIRRLSPLEIEILAGRDLAATLVAGGRGDELVVYDCHLSDDRRRQLGTAIGIAMVELAAATRWHLPGRRAQVPHIRRLPGRRLLPPTRDTAQNPS